MPRIAGLRLWTSIDGGAHWRPVSVRHLGNGVYSARTWYPRLDRTGGYVSLKVEAWDVAGNRVEQTTDRGFRLTDHPGQRR